MKKESLILYYDRKDDRKYNRDGEKKKNTLKPTTDSLISLITKESR